MRKMQALRSRGTSFILLGRGEPVFRNEPNNSGEKDVPLLLSSMRKMQALRSRGTSFSPELFGSLRKTGSPRPRGQNLMPSI